MRQIASSLVRGIGSPVFKIVFWDLYACMRISWSLRYFLHGANPPAPILPDFSHTKVSVRACMEKLLMERLKIEGWGLIIEAQGIPAWLVAFGIGLLIICGMIWIARRDKHTR